MSGVVFGNAVSNPLRVTSVLAKKEGRLWQLAAQQAMPVVA